MSEVRVGVGVIVLRDGKVLLGKRRGSHGAGEWSFPGGHLEFMEDIPDCARRELQEETGMDLLVGRQTGLYTNDKFPEESKHYITIYVFADETVGEPVVREPEKCDGWGWFAWDDLPSPLFPPIRNLVAAGFRPREAG
jgi:8-oxo-dGTP diphosphatase